MSMHSHRPAGLVLALLMAVTANSCSLVAHSPTQSSHLDLASAIDASWRSPPNRSRDRYRHPLQTLGFFGVTPGNHLIEVTPGYGWYTEILAPLLAEQGRYIAALNSPAPDAPMPSPWLDAFRATLKSDAALYGRVQITTFEFDRPKLGDPESVDVVLTFRNVHNWILTEDEEAMFAAMHRVLKPGGVLGVVEHRARPGSDPAAAAQVGYVPQAHVVELAQRAGFILEAASEINANPRDTTDHPHGVWSLPPTLAGGDVERSKYLAIGESDRMTLRFRKAADGRAATRR